MNPISDDAREAAIEQLRRVLRILENLDIGLDDPDVSADVSKAGHIVASVIAALKL